MDDKWKAIAIGAGAVAIAFVAKVITEFAVTSRGENPWSLGALVNALRISRHVYAVRAAIDGVISSMFRSEAVNDTLPNASKTSRHMEGLAVDVKPGAAFSVESAFRRIVHLARQGKFGAVRTVIWEPTWVHVDWFRDDEPARPLVTRKAVGSGKDTTYVAVTV